MSPMHEGTHITAHENTKWSHVDCGQPMQVEELAQENHALSSELSAQALMEQYRLDSWDSLRHIFLQVAYDANAHKD